MDDKNTNKSQKYNNLVDLLETEYFKRFSKYDDLDDSQRKIGLELEFPVLDINGNPPDIEVIHSLFDYIHEKFEWEPIFFKDIYYGVENLTQYEKLTFESGRVCIEYSSPPCKNIYELKKRVIQILDVIAEYLDHISYYLFCGGLSPNIHPNSDFALKIDCYHFLTEETRHHFVPEDIGKDYLAYLFTSHNSPHIDIGSRETIEVFNTLNALSGLQIALTVNSAIWKGMPNMEYKCLRNHFYEKMYPHRSNFITMPAYFPRNKREYIDYILNVPPLMISRNNSYLRILNKKSLYDFLKTSTCRASNSSGEETEVFPDYTDFFFNEHYIWTNSRLRSKFGTIENRASCQQPQKDLFCVAALILGLISNKEEAQELVSSFPLSKWVEIYSRALKNGIMIFNQEIKEYNILEEYLNIAYSGLKKRGCGEEKFLSALFKRLESLKDPADNMIDLYNEGGIKLVIKNNIYKINKSKIK